MSETNHAGLTKADYAGGKSTLCIGCGHDQIMFAKGRWA